MVLTTVAEAEEPLSVAQISSRTGLHRSIAYRMLRTLEDRALISRDRSGGYLPGGGLALLARRVAPGLQAAAAPHVERLAEQAAMTAFVVVPHDGQAVTVLVVEPRSTMAHVAYRPGAQHPLTLGAPGVAILSARPPRSDERAAVTLARERGWAASDSEVIQGYRSCAAPVSTRDGSCLGSVAVVYAGDADLQMLSALVVRCAQRTSADVG